MSLSPKPERLVNLLLLLQDRKQGWSCAELADKLEVSRRTVMRDVAALQYMGIAIDSKSGNQGGYCLAESAAIKPLELTGSEAFLLMLALDGIEQLSDIPFGASRDTLLAKVRSILPVGQTDKAKSRLDQIHLSVPRRMPRAKHLNRMIELCGAAVELEYDGEAGPERFKYTIERVYADGGFWYLSGIKNHRRRILRADRVTAVRTLEGATPEQDAIPYDDPSHPLVVVILSKRGLRSIERDPHLGHFAHGQQAPARLSFRCPPDELDWYTRYFGGMGADAVVESPPELVTMIIERARKQLDLYRVPDPKT